VAAFDRNHWQPFVGISGRVCAGLSNAQDWVKKEFGVEIKYQRIREYLIQHFRTKTKSPRKSHIKKDKQAEEAFLKTPKHVRAT
jgi:transposase